MLSSLYMSLKTTQDEDVRSHKARVKLVDHHFKQIAKRTQKYATFTKKSGSQGAKLCEEIKDSFEELEERDVSVHIDKFSKCYSSVQKLKGALSQNIHERIATEFRVYETKCNELNREIRECENLIHKHKNEECNLEKMKNRVPMDRRKFVEAQLREDQAKISSAHSKKMVQRKVERFEREKLEDTGKILREFVRLEMEFHAHALQTLTKAYRHLMNVTGNRDKEEKANATEQCADSSSGSRLSISHLN
ncbi:CBY1-interacting BAR domain-containing protein 1-like [Nematostella vectensis]|uniref:CBY1-interacting BAR domain-containing protein 1-like n=1 Tax=Nematostella vectensis TaxID=45351 RepID=UPI0013900E1C|nr:CBY1-interacting BAR domain-containing protein 1-like [Nematostella vectensis]